MSKKLTSALLIPTLATVLSGNVARGQQKPTTSAKGPGASITQPVNGEVKDPNFSDAFGGNSMLQWRSNGSQISITLMPLRYQAEYFGFDNNGISYIQDQMTMKYYGYNGKTLQQVAKLPPNLHQPHPQQTEVATGNPPPPKPAAKPSAQATQSVSLAPGKDQIAALIAQLPKTGSTGQNPLATGGSQPKDIHGKVASLKNGFLTIITDAGATVRFEAKRPNDTGSPDSLAGQWFGFDATNPGSVMSLTVAGDGTVAGTPLPPFMTDAFKQTYHFGGSSQK